MNPLKTQIGGKFSKHNLGLFDFKRRLARAGIEVKYPIGDTIVKTFNGVDLTFDPEKLSLDFYTVETEYLKSIRYSSFHTVYNTFQECTGYIGRSAGMEVAYAMLHNVPIVMLYTPFFQEAIDPAIRLFLTRKMHLFNILRLDSLPEPEIYKKLIDVSTIEVDYELSVEEEIGVMAYVQAVLKEYLPLPNVIIAPASSILA
jgi:hypothetical protein